MICVRTQANFLIGSTKVTGQGIWLAHEGQKVGGQLPALPNRHHRQWNPIRIEEVEAVITAAVFLLYGERGRVNKLLGIMSD